MRKIAKAVSSLGFVGYTPVASGTAASLAGALIYFLTGGNNPFYLVITALFLIAGFWSSSSAEENFGKKDPREVVIDEFSAMLLCFAFLPYSPKLLVTGFILFRIFDILKMPAIKRLEALPGGYGIMLDDIAAAILTNIILQVLRFTPGLM